MSKKTKGFDSKKEMNPHELKFLEGYKNKFPTHTIEKNTEKVEVGPGCFGHAKPITYTPDFEITTPTGFVRAIEVKGYSKKSNESGELKRRLVIEYYECNSSIIFEEYRSITRNKITEFYLYDQGKFEVNKIKKVKEGTAKVEKGKRIAPSSKNYENALKKYYYGDTKKYGS